MSDLPHFLSRVDRDNIRQGRRSNVLSIIANSLAVAAPIVSIVAGIWISNLNSDVVHLNATIDELNADVATSQAQLDVRQETIEDLKAENAELRAALPPSIPAEQIPDARNAGKITLASEGDSIDLNSTLQNFDAGVNPTSQDSLRYEDGEFHAPWGLHIVELASGDAAYETCAVATGYAPVRSIEPHRLEGGDVCIRMESGNYARITVESYGAERAVVTIMTWDAAR